MRNTKKKDQAQLKFIDELLQRPENQNCADCKIRGPRWASVNIGCFLCIRCAGIHRKLGADISKVKSTNLDIWQPDWLEFASSMGNEKVNQIYLSKGSPYVNPQSDSDMDEFIRNKYEKKLYASDTTSNRGLARYEQESQSLQTSSSQYARQLETMASMGFTNHAACIAALEKSKGSIEKAVESMIGKSPTSGSPSRLEEQRPTQKNLPNPNASHQIQLRNMGFTNLEINENAYQAANGNMENTVALLIEWQASNKRKSPDAHEKKQQTPVSFSNASESNPSPKDPATGDLLDIFGSESQSQPSFNNSERFTNQMNPIPFINQNQMLVTNPFNASQPTNRFTQQAIFSAPEASLPSNQSAFPAPQAPFQPQQFHNPAPQAPFQPQQFHNPAPQAPYQPQQAGAVSLNSLQPAQGSNPFQIQHQMPNQDQQGLPFVNPQIMLFQQTIKPVTGLESNDDLFKVPQPASNQTTSFQNQFAPPQPSQAFQNNQNSVDYSKSQLFGGSMKGMQPQQNQTQSNPFQAAPVQNPQEKLMQEQNNEFEQKKNRDIQKDSILSMYRAAPQQQGFNGNFGIQQGGFANNMNNNNTNPMMNNQGYGIGGIMQQQPFGYGSQSQMNNQPYGFTNMYEPRIAGMNPAPRQAPKPDMTGDIFKTTSTSQANLNFARAQDKNSNLLGDLNLFGK